MVRVNLVNPKCLTDQHLVAEYLEIMMLLAYVRKHPQEKEIPRNYCLGKGHIKFFKNKALYLKKRHELLRKEMRKRGFRATKSLDFKDIDKKLLNDWQPKPKDFHIIKERLRQKISLKPDWYRYYGRRRTKKFLLKLIS